ncbi:unnamed protein product [Heligmosomoides polygyrus]|uniref:Laminin N-terminal domain-containing protein n=1 Tax=Heligmosomoides polygyrus TaxID=6339 RepID=A0A183FZK5_HELPZ|nr:unnamed protein product [Heligmosomoides polygyrus]
MRYGRHPLDEGCYRPDSAGCQENTMATTNALVDFFVKALNVQYDALRVPRARVIRWSTLALALARATR